MAALPEKLYALHDFEAENPDEVSFKAGDTILVVEKDDAYGDGWWQVSLRFLNLTSEARRMHRVETLEICAGCLHLKLHERFNGRLNA
jgi:SH3 domain